MRARAVLALAAALLLSGAGTAAAWPMPPTIVPTGCHVRGALPDPVCTKGSLNPDVTQATIGTTICHPGWAKTVRPDAYSMRIIKLLRMAQYGIKGPPSAYSLDHLVPIENGGAPMSADNLWPQLVAGPYGSRAKDKEEGFQKREVCSEKRTLAQAQHEMATDWVSAYKRDVLHQ